MFKARQLTFDPTQQGFATWSPDVKSTIWKISSDGKEKKQIFDQHENFYRYLALSPDGSLLVYAAKENQCFSFTSLNY